MLRAMGKKNETECEIRRRFSGLTAFADDLNCVPLKIAIQIDLARLLRRFR